MIDFREICRNSSIFIFSKTIYNIDKPEGKIKPGKDKETNEKEVVPLGKNPA